MKMGEEAVVKDGELISGEAYVWVVLRGYPDALPGRIRTRRPKNCDHTVTICTECVPMWEEDYIIDYRRTSAAVKLREALHSES